MYHSTTESGKKEESVTPPPYTSDTVYFDEESTARWHGNSMKILENSWRRLTGTVADRVSVSRVSGSGAEWYRVSGSGYPRSGDALVVVSGTGQLDAPVGRAVQAALMDYLTDLYGLVGVPMAHSMSSPLFPPNWHTGHLRGRVPLPTVWFAARTGSVRRALVARHVVSSDSGWPSVALAWLPQWVSAEVVHYSYLFGYVFDTMDAGPYELRSGWSSLSVIPDLTRFERVFVLDVGSASLFRQSQSGIDTLLVHSGDALLRSQFDVHGSQARLVPMTRETGTQATSQLCRSVSELVATMPVCARIDFGTVGVRRTRHSLDWMDALDATGYEQVRAIARAHVRHSVFPRRVKWKKHVVRRGVRAVLKLFFLNDSALAA